MSTDSSSEDRNSCFVVTATTEEEESSSSSIFAADSFRSLDLPPGYFHGMKSSILASPRARSARQYTNSVDEFDGASSAVSSCRFYEDYSFVDGSDWETGSEAQLLVDRSRQKVRPAGTTGLKPPPARQLSGTTRSRTPSHRRRSPFHRRSLWNDDFDPFMAALKNVRREEGKEKDRAVVAGGVASHRRAWSDSLRHIGPRPGPEAMKAERTLMWMKSMPRARVRSPSPGPGRPGQGQVPGPGPGPAAKMKSPQPKGVLYARHTRMVRLGSNVGRQDKEAAIMDAASCRCGSNREIIKHMMVSMKGRTAAEEEAAAAAAEEEEKKKKLKEEKPKLSRRKRLMRKLSFNKSRNGNEEEEKKRAPPANVDDGTLLGRKKMGQSKSSLLGCVGIKNKIYAGC